MTIEFSGGVVFWDIESHGVEELGTMPPEKYFRLGQYAIDEGPVITTTDFEEFLSILSWARMLIGANIIGFDLPAIYGDTMAAVRLARAGRLLDTHVFAMTANPPPFGTFEPYTGGKPMVCTKPEHFRKWIKLDQQAFSLGVQGKTGDINDIADRFWYREEPVLTKTGKPSLSKGVPRTRRVRDESTEGACCKFGIIPTDDPQFLEYAERDVTVVREVARKQLERMPFDRYARSEMLKAALAVQIGRGNGFAVDIPATRAREKAIHEEAAWILDGLREDFGFPVGTAKPLATKVGKEAIVSALASYGVPESKLARTESGAPSFSAESVTAAVEGQSEGAVAFGTAVAALAGQRSLAELLLAEVRPDGRVHPDIFAFQRSGRFSTTKPGLTIWDPRFKDLLVAEEGFRLVEFDYSNADARGVAAMSGDRAFARRFEPGQDGHLINAWLLWGKEKVGLDKHDPGTAAYRQDAKAPGHGIGYNMGAWKMAQTTGLPLKTCRTFIANYRREYSGVTRWQEAVVAFAVRYGFVVSDWGRRMPVEPGREHTQAVGLLGQNATHEILCEGVARCDDRRLSQIQLTIHDAFIAAIPVDRLEEDIAYYQKTFTTTWHPKGGQAIDFTLGSGTPSRTWADAAH